jgi:LysM repeat protein
MKPLSEEVATLAANEADKNALKVNNTTTQHRIAQGETLEEIAKQYETTIDALRSLNQSLNERRLQVGDVLQVPAKQADKNKMTQTNSSKASSNYSS